ncbi:hypothetical protein J7E99_07145 [Streptomyces sp. ISL-44]|nr:hypothetical protein [Streptomyces sp. ISL-44]
MSSRRAPGTHSAVTGSGPIGSPSAQAVSRPDRLERGLRGQCTLTYGAQPGVRTEKPAARNAEAAGCQVASS